MVILNPRFIDLVSPGDLDELRTLPPASIGHVLDEEFMDPLLRPVGSRFSFCGAAVTVRCYGMDSAIVHHAVEVAEPGDVIVVDRVGDRRYACWGGGVSLAAHVKGLAGAVVDGMLTDKVEIEDMGFHVFGRGISPITTRAPGLKGDINVPVTCGGLVVNPGDIVLADDDGILVLPPHRVREIIDTFKPRVQREPEAHRKLEEGGSLAEMSGATKRLKETISREAGA